MLASPAATGQSLDDVLRAHGIEADPAATPGAIHFDLASLHTLNMSEDRHYWAAERRALVLDCVRRFARPPLNFLDIGCGNGTLLKDIEDTFPGSHALGVDGYIESLIHCRQRSPTVALRLQDIAQERWPEFDRTYDVVTLLDVLEHLDDPAAVLAQARRILAPGGVLIASVPAHPFLWSARDVFLGHRRRYTRATLLELLRQSGFDVVHTSHLFSYLWLPALLHRRLGGRDGQRLEQRELRLPPINGPLAALGRLEAKLSLALPLPFGTSIYAVARVGA